MKSPISDTEMVARPAPSEDQIVQGMVDAGHQPAYAQQFAKRQLAKEKEFGVIHVDPSNGYTTRVKKE